MRRKSKLKVNHEMKQKKRLALTAVSTLIVTIILDVSKAIEKTDFLIAYMIVFLFLNLHFSE